MNFDNNSLFSYHYRQ